MYHSIILHRCHKNIQTTLLNEHQFPPLKQFNLLYIKNNRELFKPHVIVKNEAMYLYKKYAERDGIKYFDISHNNDIVNVYVYECISSEMYVFIGDINIEKFTIIVKNQKNTDIYKYLTHILYRNSKYNSEVFNNDKTNTIKQMFTYPNNSHYIPSNTKFDEIDRRLYSYQKENVKWMLHTEENIINNKPIYFSNDETEIGDVFFHKYHLTLTEDYRERYFIKINGGMLADSPGLGKSAQILSLIQLRCVTNEYLKINKYDDEEIENITRENSYATNITNMSYFIPRSKSTLIIIQPQIFCQWLNEIEKWYNTSKYNYNIVYGISNINEYNRYMCIRSEIEPEIILLTIDIYLQYKTEFNSIKWWRLVIDEAHEILNNEEYYFNELYAEYKWLITGTPNANSMYFENYIKYLCLGTLHGKYLLEKNPKLLNCFYNEMFRRNTYDSVKNEIILPDINMDIRMLNFTENERQIYNSTLIGLGYNTTLLRQLCCHPVLLNKAKEYIINCQTIEEFKKGLLQYFEKDRDEYMVKYINCKEYVYGLHEEFNKIIGDEEKKGVLLKDIEEGNIRLQNIEKLVLNKQNMYLYSSTINELEEYRKEEGYPDCPVCINSFEDRDIVVIKCGHKYCSECISVINERDSKCPMCRCEIDNKFNYRINLKALKMGIREDTDINGLVLKEGTKIGNVIEYLRVNKEKYILLFCEWEDILLKIKTILMKYKIGTIYCLGDAYEQYELIKRFEESEGEDKIMLICAKNYVSGVSLTKATEVIFVNPLMGEENEYVSPYEEQAIGRIRRIGQLARTVNVIKFIIRDTIEEDSL